MKSRKAIVVRINKTGTATRAELLALPGVNETELEDAINSSFLYTVSKSNKGNKGERIYGLRPIGRKVATAASMGN